MKTSSNPLTHELFTDFLCCERKAYLKFAGQSGEKSEYEQILKERFDDYKNEALKSLIRRYPGHILNNPTFFDDIFKKQYSIVINAVLCDSKSNIVFHALACQKEKKYLKRPEYAPVLFSPGNKIVKEHKLLLSFCGIILGEKQKRIPQHGLIVYGSAYTIAKIKLGPLFGIAEKTISNITSFRSEWQPPLMLNSHCPVCEFRNRCHDEAVKKDDVSLIRGLSKKEIMKLNSRGIFTATQYSYTFRPRRKKGKHRLRKHDHSLQALAIRTNKIHVFDQPKLPGTSNKLYLDIEGDPDAPFYYLIGCLICSKDETKSFQFWADNKSDELRNWNELLGIIDKFEDFTVYHYGSFESRYMKQMERFYGISPLSKKLRDNSFNILSAIHGQLYFPVYSNSLKAIAAYLGFHWTAKDASGIQSLMWRYKWERTASAQFKNNLLVYNNEDCKALGLVENAILHICDGAKDKKSAHLIFTDEMQDIRPRYGNINFFFPELNKINNCAYFDYQRNRVYLRTSPAVRTSIQREKKLRKHKVIKKKKIHFKRPLECPHCGAFMPYKHGYYSTIIYDLKIMNSGIKKNFVRYITSRYRCIACKKTLNEKNKLKKENYKKYGHSLIGWVVYQLIVLLNSFEAISQQLHEIFDLNMNRNSIGRIKINAAEYYRPVYQDLIEKIKTGTFVNVDETKVNIIGDSGKGESCYVWSFSNHEEVVYVYSESREGKILREVLNGFDGILISDFYSAYDGMECKQQKCLIHLIRDMNNDLFKNQFDNELQMLCKEFTFILKSIIETIDRFGLKKRYLSRHSKTATAFIEQVSDSKFHSEAVQGYQKRFKKYKDKLFTFLNHDGIPWNNNNAEHSLKRVADFRRAIKSASSPAGMQQYLILFSMVETLKLRKISPFKFLVSGSRDIDNFKK
ncbi:MAG: IS66 family transposase [Actinomycetota bacterium]|nr:IS66 family transposase [Actinomycetota bacterium]